MSLQVRETSRPWVFLCLILAGLAARAVDGGEAEIRMRVETLTVPPATGPLAMVTVHNPRAEPWEGEILLQPPESWQLSPGRREIALAPGQMQRLAFNIARGRNLEANRYPFEVTASRSGHVTTHRQETFVASAPYFRVDVDGRADEWQDAIPVTFQTDQQSTTVSTYWSRRHFSLLVAVQQQELVPLDETGQSPFDAVQFAISPVPLLDEPADVRTAGRFEFLLAATRDGGAKCFQLATWETRLDETAPPRPLGPLVCEQVEVAVRRDGGTTYYECSVPFRLLDGRLQPDAGREFYFSVLVHDPEGTGIRDLGRLAGLWPSDTDQHAWSRWPGACWGDVLPRGNKIRWGLCTSKY